MAVKMPAVLGLTVALSAPAAPLLAGGCEVPPVNVRIVTFNVREGLGNPGSSEYLAIGDFLTTNDVDGPGPNMGLNPDIVALQECRSNTNLTTFRDTYLPGYNFFRTNNVDAGGNFNAYFVNPAYVVQDVDELFAGASPRRLLRITLLIPETEAGTRLTVYNHHFKAFDDVSSQNTRRAQADGTGIIIYEDQTLGLDLDDNGSRETPGGFAVLVGDLNSSNNNDGTIDGVFTHATLNVPTGIANCPVEALAGHPIPVLWLISTVGGARFDYICPDDDLVAQFFDTNSSGSYPLPPTQPTQADQDEINSRGFVYFSGDDNGMMSNGNSAATSTASDHRPVVMDLPLPRDPSTISVCPGDADGSNTVDVNDLNQVIGNFGVTGGMPCGPGDVTGDGNVDIGDLNAVLGNFGLICQ